MLVIVPPVGVVPVKAKSALALVNRKMKLLEVPTLLLRISKVVALEVMMSPFWSSTSSRPGLGLLLLVKTMVAMTFAPSNGCVRVGFIHPTHGCTDWATGAIRIYGR